MTNPTNPLLAALEPFALIADSVENTDKRDGEIVHRQRKSPGEYLELTKDDFRRAKQAYEALSSAPAVGEAVEAMRQACIEAVRAEKKYEASDFPVCNSIVRAIEQIPAHPTAAVAGEGEDDGLLADANSWYSQAQLDEIANLRGRISAAIKASGTKDGAEHITMEIGPGEPGTHGRYCWDNLRFTADDVVAIAAALSQPAAVAGEGVGPRWVIDPKYNGPVISFDVKPPYYLASCDCCGWVGSSEHCGTDSGFDDSDVYCPRCHHPGADCGKVANLSQPAGDALRNEGMIDQVILDHRIEGPYFQYRQTPAWAASCKCGHSVFADSSGEVSRQWAMHVAEALASTKSPDADGGEA